MKKFFRSLYMALGLFAGGAVAAWAGALVIFTGPSGTNPINFPADLADMNTVINTINGLLNLNTANTSIATLSPMGRVYTQTGPTTLQVAGTTGVTIATYTVPANSLDAPGRTLHIHASFHVAAIGDSKSVACGWGSQAVTKTYTAGTNGADSGFCDLWVVEGVTANTQMVWGQISLGTTPTITNLTGTTANSSTTSGVTNASFQVAAPTALGDVQLDNFEVIYEN